MMTVKEVNKMVNLLAQGESQRAVAGKVGVTPLTVNRWANKEEIRQRIEEQAAKLIESLPDAVDLSRKVIALGKREAAKIESNQDADKDLIDMGLKEGNRIQQSTGIAVSHAPSVIINNILVDNSQNLVLPSVQGLLDNVIDITPSDSDAS